MRYVPSCDCRIRIFLSLVVLASGCHAPRTRQVAANGDSSGYYSQMSARVTYPEADEPTTISNEQPRAIHEPKDDEIWPLSLHEALHIGLTNNKMILVNTDFLSDNNRLLRNPELTPSVFDMAIQDSGILVGNRGVPAALSDFDPRLTTSMLWGRDENVQNNLFLSGGLPPGETLVDENAAFSARLAQTLSTGGELAFTHDWNYSSNNSRARLFPSAYDGSAGIEFRQPLWAGSGREFTSIAGPIGQVNERVTGVSQGIVIARINRDISLDDFEVDVRNQMYDITNVYWDLYLAHEEYAVQREIRDRTKQTWEQVKAKNATGVTGGGAADEAQANEEYLASRARTEVALAVVWETEGRLRRLMGMPANDCRLIKPCDPPTTEAVHMDWQQFLCNALMQRSELRRQKSSIKSLQLQLCAAKSLVAPRVDLVAGYKVNGFGDQLIAPNDNDGVTAQGHRSAYGNLFQGNQTSWDLGVVMSVPLEMRAERSQVRNLELRVSKAMAALHAQELEVSHELAHAFNILNRSYTTANTNSERRTAADRRVNAFEAEYVNGRTSLDALLRARISQAESRLEYLRSVSDYNKAIAEIHYRSGTLCESYNIQLSERREEKLKPSGDTASIKPGLPVNPADDSQPPELAAEPRERPS